MSISVGATLFLSLAFHSTPDPFVTSHATSFGQELQRPYPVRIAEADLNAIIPGTTGSSNPVISNPEPTQPVHPSYQSWDVLRQYPRYNPPAQPSAPATKQQEAPKDAKENKHA